MKMNINCQGVKQEAEDKTSEMKIQHPAHYST